MSALFPIAEVGPSQHLAVGLLPASAIDRLIFVPAVLIPVAMAGVFPHLILTFAILDVLLALGAWTLFARK
jgi:hypothetical protein